MELVTLVQRQVLEILSLVNGIRHESKHHSPTGLITELKFYNAKLSTGIAWLKRLPQPVLSQLSVLALSRCQLCPKSFELLAEAIVMRLDTKVKLFGEWVEFPICVAPTAMQCMAHCDGGGSNCQR